MGKQHLGALATFLLLTGAPCILADVYIMTSTYTFDPIPDVAADFGPEIGDGGIGGILRVADPEDSCSPYTFQDWDRPWVALIARQQQYKPTNCTFDVKVMHAQEAGAIAAIVYDDTYEALIIMSKPPGNPEPNIPAVFVSQKAGIIMKKLLALDDIRVNITPVTAIAWISMLMSAFLGLLALTVVLATFYVMRSWSLWIGSQQARHGQQARHTGAGGGAANRPQDGGLSPRTLRSLPVLIYECSRSCSLPQTPLKSFSSLGNNNRGGDDDDDDTDSLLGNDGDTYDDGNDNDNAAECASQHSNDSSDGGYGTYAAGAGVDPVAAATGLPRPRRAPGAHAGETKRVCAICLEDYCEGDKVRQLPCHHRFHMGCIDQWLAGRRFCPVCKHDASKPLLPPPAPAEAVGQSMAAASAAAGAGGAGGAAAAGGAGGGGSGVAGRRAAGGSGGMIGSFMRGVMRLMNGAVNSGADGVNGPASQPAAAGRAGRRGNGGSRNGGGGGGGGGLNEPLLAGGGVGAASFNNHSDMAMDVMEAGGQQAHDAVGAGAREGGHGRWGRRGLLQQGGGGGDGLPEALAARIAALAARVQAAAIGTSTGTSTSAGAGSQPLDIQAGGTMQGAPGAGAVDGTHRHQHGHWQQQQQRQAIAAAAAAVGQASAASPAQSHRGPGHAHGHSRRSRRAAAAAAAAAVHAAIDAASPPPSFSSAAVPAPLVAAAAGASAAAGAGPSNGRGGNSSTARRMPHSQQQQQGEIVQVEDGAYADGYDDDSDDGYDDAGRAGGGLSSTRMAGAGRGGVGPGSSRQVPTFPSTM